MTMTEDEVADAVYEKLRELGFDNERIALMPKDELKIWVTAVLREYSDAETNG